MSFIDLEKLNILNKNSRQNNNIFMNTHYSDNVIYDV